MPRKKPEGPIEITGPTDLTELPARVRKKASQLLRKGDSATVFVIAAGTGTLTADLGAVIGFAKLVALHDRVSLIALSICWILSLSAVVFFWIIIFFFRPSSK